LLLFVSLTALRPAAVWAADTAPATSPPPVAHILLVVGAAGTKEFGEAFAEWTGDWNALSASEQIPLQVVGQDEPGEQEDKARIQEWLAGASSGPETTLWLVLLGHGTYDGKEAKFNLRGPDVSANELKEWLAPVRQPVVIINAASSSGPFIASLSGTNRVVVTATRSGDENNYARFGRYLSRAMGRPDADLDKDGQTSLLEAFLHASREVEAWYEQEGRLATEHALLDDNHDGRGTPADWFEGVRAVKKAADGALPDGLRAHQIHLVPSETERRMPPEIRQRRDALELALAGLRERKASLEESVYYGELEDLLVALAGVYDEADRSD